MATDDGSTSSFLAKRREDAESRGFDSADLRIPARAFAGHALIPRK